MREIRLKKTILLIMAVLIFLVVILMLGWEDVYSVISRMTMPQIILMTMLQLGTLFLTTFIWYYLLKQKSKQVTLASVFGINMAGSFVESVTPSVKVGGEALKVYLIQKETALNYPELTAITLMSKFFSMLPFLLISFITLCIAFFTIELPLFVYVAFVGLVLFVLLFLVVFNFQNLGLGTFLTNLVGDRGKNHLIITKIHGKVIKIHNFLTETSIKSKTVIEDPGKRFLLFSVAFIVWAFYPVKVYLVASMLGYQLNPVIVIIATYTAYMVGMIPLLPGGLATFEGSLALVLAYEGLAAHEAFSIALMTRVITFWIPLLISAIAAIYYINKTNKGK